MIDVRNEIAARIRQDAPAGMSNLQVRIVSAICLAAVVLTVTWIGGVPFRFLTAAISLVILYEWIMMRAKHQTTGYDMAGLILLAVVLVCLVAGVSITLLAILLVIAFAVCLVPGIVLGRGSWNAWGLLYAGVGGVALAHLRGDDHAGLVAILFLFAVVWATDTLAYFSGRSIGGAKLAPRISPNKTWSGALGGAAAAVGAGILVATLAGKSGGWTIPVVALILSVVSQSGDLFESWIKRLHDVKDSSALIPGHGGVMDRVDGLVAAAFALYLIGWSLADATNPAHGLFSG